MLVLLLVAPATNVAQHAALAVTPLNSLHALATKISSSKGSTRALSATAQRLINAMTIRRKLNGTSPSSLPARS